METDWCICGQKVYDPNAFYCSSECANNENPSMKQQSMNSGLNTPPPTPPLNLHFSITITSNFYKTNSNAKVMSPPPSADSSYTDNVLSSFTIDQNYNYNDHVYTYRNHGKEDTVDDDYYTSYYSTSNPIDIPSSRTQVADDPAVETINKGTFGEDKSIF